MTSTTEVLQRIHKNPNIYHNFTFGVRTEILKLLFNEDYVIIATPDISESNGSVISIITKLDWKDQLSLDNFFQALIYEDDNRFNEMIINAIEEKMHIGGLKIG